MALAYSPCLDRKSLSSIFFLLSNANKTAFYPNSPVGNVIEDEAYSAEPKKLIINFDLILGL